MAMKIYGLTEQVRVNVEKRESGSYNNPDELQLWMKSLNLHQATIFIHYSHGGVRLSVKNIKPVSTLTYSLM